MSQDLSRQKAFLNFVNIRKTIGWLGALLPLFLYAGVLLITQHVTVLDSVSHYYFTVMGAVFVGILSAIGVFLILYKYDETDPLSKRDNLLTNIAGGMALLVAFFPTTNIEGACDCKWFEIANTDLTKTRATIHYASAAGLLLILAYISAFQFTRSDGFKTDRKILRNKIYRVCAAIIVLSIALIALYHWDGKTSGYRFTSIRPVFILEWLAFAAFGFSWLVKGKVIFEDKVV
jgi:hypothetical protein